MAAGASFLAGLTKALASLSEHPVLRPPAEDIERSEQLNERIALLTGQSVPIFRCGRERRFNAD
ncbi:MAG: hypothetical protein WB679_11090, partial [Terracidiphilus sp.]